MYIDEIINYLQKIKKVNSNNCLEFVDLYGEYDMKKVIESINHNTTIKETEKKKILQNLRDIVLLDAKQRQEKMPTEKDLKKIEEEEIKQEDTDDNEIDNFTKSIVKQYLDEVSIYPLLTKEEEQKYGKDLKLKNDINIRIKKKIKNKIEPMLDLETIFVSIDNQQDKDYVLTSLNKYLFNYMNKSSNNECAMKYYLLEYEKLCKKLNHIPNANELNERFSKNNIYNIFTNFNGDKKITSKELHDQIDKYIKYEISRKKFINSNLRMVIGISKKYLGNNLEFLDLINEGNIGLIKSLERFDVDKGYKFSTYATFWIKQEINRALADKSRTIRVPVCGNERIMLIKKTQRSFFQMHGREATLYELEEKLNIPYETLRILISANQPPKSLSTVVGEDGDSTLGDFIEDSRQSVETEIINNEFTKKMQDLVNSLENEREIIVLKKRFGLENNQAMTLEEVGKEMGVTRERVRQIEAKALKKIRIKAKNSGLKDYL